MLLGYAENVINQDAAEIALNPDKNLYYFGNLRLYGLIKDYVEEGKIKHDIAIPYGRFKIRKGREEEDKRFIDSYAETLNAIQLPVFLQFVDILNRKASDPKVDRKLKVVFLHEITGLEDHVCHGLKIEFEDNIKFVDFMDMRGRAEYEI